MDKLRLLPTWLEKIERAEKMAVIIGGAKKFHYKFGSGADELIEEYDLTTKMLIKRSWKRKNKCPLYEYWDVEVGQPIPQKTNSEFKDIPGSPYVVHRITKKSLEWRIYNLPYEQSVYTIVIDDSKLPATIVVSTTNKKYYKRIPMYDLQIAKVTPDEKLLRSDVVNNTLIITYPKPKEVMDLERAVKAILDEVPVVTEF